MPRPPVRSSGARIWRVEGLRNLELVDASELPATTTVHRDTERASAIVLPVMSR